MSEDPFAGAYSFRRLNMWQKAQDLADEVIGLAERMPNTRAGTIVANQIVRSSTSIAANIAEGHGRFTPATYRNHLSIARGSTTETVSWLDLMRRRGWVSADEERSALTKCAEIMRMVTGKMADLDRQRQNRAGEERAVYDATGVGQEMFDV